MNQNLKTPYGCPDIIDSIFKYVNERRRVGGIINHAFNCLSKLYMNKTSRAPLVAEVKRLDESCVEQNIT